MTWEDALKRLNDRFAVPKPDVTQPIRDRIGGCILADSMDTLLRHLSLDYLAAAWDHVAVELGRQMPIPQDLAWGAMHSGVTFLAGPHVFAPISYLGLVSYELATLYSMPAWAELAATLPYTSPSLRPAETDRGWHAGIPPTDFESALAFVRWYCWSDRSYWSPQAVVQNHPDDHAPWVQIAHAFLAGSQAALNTALEHARTAYSPEGYQLMLGGYNAFQAAGQGDPAGLRLPPWPDW